MFWLETALWKPINIISSSIWNLIGMLNGKDLFTCFDWSFFSSNRKRYLTHSHTRPWSWNSINFTACKQIILVYCGSFSRNRNALVMWFDWLFRSQQRDIWLLVPSWSWNLTDCIAWEQMSGVGHIPWIELEGISFCALTDFFLQQKEIPDSRTPTLVLWNSISFTACKRMFIVGQFPWTGLIDFFSHSR